MQGLLQVVHEFHSKMQLHSHTYESFLDMYHRMPESVSLRYSQLFFMRHQIRLSWSPPPQKCYKIHILYIQKMIINKLNESKNLWEEGLWFPLWIVALVRLNGFVMRIIKRPVSHLECADTVVWLQGKRYSLACLVVLAHMLRNLLLYTRGANSVIAGWETSLMMQEALLLHLLV